MNRNKLNINQLAVISAFFIVIGDFIALVAALAALKEEE